MKYRMKWMRCWLVLPFLCLSVSAHANNPSSTLRILTWEDYIDPDVVQAFESEYKTKIQFTYFESDDERDEILLKPNARFDLAITSGHSLSLFLFRGLLDPLDYEAMPNVSVIDERWSSAFRGAEFYGVPYFWGTLGVAYRKDLLKTPIQSWMDMLKPNVALHGKIAMLDTAADVVAVALKGLGYSMNSGNLEHYSAAEELLKTQRQYVGRYETSDLDETAPLVTGDVVASMMFNGDALMLQEENENIEFVLPKEGGPLWVDYFVISRNSTKKKLATQFLDFINRPEIAAQNAQYVYYPSPNKAAEKLLPDEFKQNAVVYPDQRSLALSEFFEAQPPRITKLVKDIYEELVSED